MCASSGLTWNAEAVVTLRPGAREPGRGAYTCRSLACFERARTRSAFNRVLRQTVQVEPALARLYTDANG